MRGERSRGEQQQSSSKINEAEEGDERLYHYTQTGN
jgi:hypothetical protein